MTLEAHQISRVGFTVERFNSEWIPFEYRMFYCRRKNDVKNDVYYAEWASESVGLMSEFGFNHTFRSMKIGERRRYFAHVELFCYSDYFGEYDNDMHILKMKRVK